MKTYTNNKFTGHYPVGTAAVVRANTPEKAAEVLNETLRTLGLDGDAKAEDMEEWPGFGQLVRILADGNY
jgi:hypothetical protein